MSQSWTLRSFNIIIDSFNEMRRDKTYSNLTDEQIFRKVSRKRYPFGERANWPYKAWLKAMGYVKEFRRTMVYNATGIDTEGVYDSNGARIDPTRALKARKKKAKKSKVVDEGQQMLIGME